MPDPGVPRRSPLILVADDGTTTRLLVEHRLSGEGFSVMRAANGDRPLEIFEAERPDLIPLDVRMASRDLVTPRRGLGDPADRVGARLTPSCSYAERARRRRRRELLTTLTELRAMAALAKTGDSKSPNAG